LTELSVIEEEAARLDRTARICLRLNPDVNPQTHPYVSTGLRENKFGLTEADVFLALSHFRLSPHLRFRGLSIHIGSQLTKISPLREAFNKLVDSVVRIEKKFLIGFESIDLGGGLGVRYAREPEPTIEEYCRLIGRYFGPKGILKHRMGRPYGVVIEPGRKISANAGILVTRVMARKQRPEKDFLVTDAGMNDLLRPALYGSTHGIVAVDQERYRERIV